MNTELQSSITSMKNILPIFPSGVAPVIGVAHQLQSMVTDINITNHNVKMLVYSNHHYVSIQ